MIDFKIFIYYFIIFTLISANDKPKQLLTSTTTTTPSLFSTTNIINTFNNNLTKFFNETIEIIEEKLHQNNLNNTHSEKSNDIKMNPQQQPSIDLTNILHLKMPDPWPIDQIKPKIVFFKLGHHEYELDYDSDPKQTALTLNKLGFLKTDRLILITHGFHNNFNNDWLHNFKDKILNISVQLKIEQTVAILGWGGGADILVFRYRQAASNVLVVGEWLANYLKTIKDVKPNINIYGIGHSLGAHVMGVAGRISKSFERITGLDPAGPCFEKVENSQTLRASDANFVDVIHTDGYDSKLDPSEWFFPVNHYGSLIPIGSIDFYPNYGYHQPGAGAFTVAGSHLRAIDLFEWSISNPNKFVTEFVLTSTPDYDEPVTSEERTKYISEMGYYADQWQLPPINASTLYYLKTNKEEPWV